MFRGVDNRMRSGYLLRDVIDKVNGIRFAASDALLTLGTLHESMLPEMRDAAGDSGEFYTPRAVVRFMVKVTDPRRSGERGMAHPRFGRDSPLALPGGTTTQRRKLLLNTVCSWVLSSRRLSYSATVSLQGAVYCAVLYIRIL